MGFEKRPMLMAVVKSNAYGHGMIECARILSGRTATSGTTAGKIDWFGVDDIDEALALRKAGIKLPILVLGYTLPTRYTEAAKNNVSLTFASLESLYQLKTQKSKGKITVQNPKLKIHLKLETGLNRQGITLEELEDGCQMLEKLKSKTILEGIYSHFAVAELATIPKYKKYCEQQMDRFEKMYNLIISNLTPNTYNLKPIMHMAGTAATLLLPRSRYDLVRVGIGMYGLDPTSDPSRPLASGIRSRGESSSREVSPLFPALSWYSIISQIKKVKKNEGIGYNLSEHAKKNLKIAIVPVGYWHGYPRSLSGPGDPVKRDLALDPPGFVLVRNKKCKILGRISMDMMTIDVTDIRNIRVGDKVTLIGSGLPAEAVSAKAGTINYELVTRINQLLPRIYK